MSDLEEVLKISRRHFHRYIEEVKESDDLVKKKTALDCAEAIYKLEGDLMKTRHRESDEILSKLEQLLRDK